MSQMIKIPSDQPWYYIILLLDQWEESWLLFVQNQICSWFYYCLYAAISTSRYKQILKNCS